MPEQCHDNDVNTSRVTTDPYQTQQSQSPIRRQPRSLGSSGCDTSNVQSPGPRHSTTRHDANDTLPDHHVGHEVHIGSDNSSQFKQSPPSPERWPRNAKRDNDGAGLDKSWVMKQPHNAVQAITHRIWGGTNEGRTTDSCVTTCVVNPHATICVVKPHTTICVVNSHLAICVVNPREDKT
jgi:hypothetical protein